MKVGIYNKMRCFFIFLFFALAINAQQVWEKKGNNQFVLNTEVLNSKLKQINVGSPKVEVLFPNMEGDLIPFIIYDNAVLPQSLASKYPEIHSYKGVSKYDPSLILRFTCIPSGIAGTLIQGNHILNLSQADLNSNYALLDASSQSKMEGFNCAVSKKSVKNNTLKSTQKRSNKTLSGDNRLIEIRLAVATTGEIADFFIQKSNLTSGTEAQKKAAVLGGISTSINNINVVFERDLGVRFQLIPDTDKLLFLDKNTDPFDDSGNLNVLIDQAGDVIRNTIPFDSYDLGHLIASEGNGGFASIGATCTDFKGEAVTGFSNPEGFFFDFTLLAHELGHQLGGFHTQSADCQTETPVEVGSGTTIMGYSGACGSNDVQSESDPFFHSLSIDQIIGVLRDLAMADTSSSRTERSTST